MSGSREQETTDDSADDGESRDLEVTSQEDETDRGVESTDDRGVESPDDRGVESTDERGDTSPPDRGTEGKNGQSDTGGWRLFARDIAVSITAVLLLGAFLFAISGIWPPMVAIESGSMEPNMKINDLVFVMDTDRFQPEIATGETGIVTATTGAGANYSQFGEYGDVIVFEPNGDSGRTPIIHRAMFWIEEGENWCQRADSDYLGNTSPDDEQCISPHDGFITKGDNNPTYDQVGNQISEPVQPEWVVGTAEVRIPGLGWLRLRT